MPPLNSVRSVGSIRLWPFRLFFSLLSLKRSERLFRNLGILSQNSQLPGPQLLYEDCETTGNGSSYDVKMKGTGVADWNFHKLHLPLNIILGMPATCLTNAYIRLCKSKMYLFSSRNKKAVKQENRNTIGLWHLKKSVINTEPQNQLRLNNSSNRKLELSSAFFLF